MISTTVSTIDGDRFEKVRLLHKQAGDRHILELAKFGDKGWRISIEADADDYTVEAAVELANAILNAAAEAARRNQADRA